MTANFLSTELRTLLKREVCNEHALLEMLEAVQSQFSESTTVGDVLATCTLLIDGELNNGDPSAEDVAELEDFRRREKRDREAEQHFGA